MSEALTALLAGGAGLLLGTLFYGGLWWTVRAGVNARRPALLFLGSLLARMGAVVAGFYLVGGDDWRRFLVCLAGFMVARLAVTRLTRPAAGRTPAAPATPATPATEPPHAP